MGHLELFERPCPIFTCLHLVQCGGLSFLQLWLSVVMLGLTLLFGVANRTGGGCGLMPKSLELTSFNAASKFVSLLLSPMSSKWSSSSSSFSTKNTTRTS